MKPSPAISVLLLIFLVLFGMLFFCAVVFGQGQDAYHRQDSTTVFTATIYPEPVGGQLNIRVEGTHANENLVFQLIRINGDVVFNRNIHSVGRTTVRVFRRPMIGTGYYLYRVIRQSNGQMVQGRITFK